MARSPRRAAAAAGAMPDAAPHSVGVSTDERPAGSAAAPASSSDTARPLLDPSRYVADLSARGPLNPKQDRDRATLGHLSLALGLVGPLVVWLLYRDRGPFTAQESKEALNFSAPPTLVALLLMILGILPVIGPLLTIAGALVWMAMALYGIMGASHVTKGRPFRYPFNLRILR